ncbi:MULTISPECIES: iron-hydroxamate ABC transporter substrate-binding protein [unclassified Paenibacillus]|uniref:iron-hydroxamate ABC transporter substrate-binding protein n=1 Tax=unclassified Paenibacillus TaxID=185978 RepID=UPI000955C1F2|nr:MULTISPECIES: iron-hydroxamate ABC transporter substrate-binding protein [unclassified Paenibacillus]ASS64817.1 iron-hydroxamate ABC transporter substrate-binding protein [Paenibacillus sp. RUD330]SIR05046.1 iron complex transport system substrate-binding protein [Paenibacillus sp. RU4X]SIR30290.1 iron complex transport system substrate-binding protein [Paenibacillus sp. RU4T]
MKKLLVPALLALVLLLSACGSTTSDNAGSANTGSANSGAAQNTASGTENTAEPAATGTITYQSENGPVEVPANPQRVVVLASYTGNVIALGVNLVGVESWSKDNPRFKDKIAGAEEVSTENLEKIVELNPDLIIAASTDKNIDKLKEIAPTVTFTYNKVDYLTQHLEIGKLLNKEKEAQAWIDDFKARSKAAGEEIRAKIGEDATVSVTENFDKQIYVFGDAWGRGTEILYQEMKLKMPQKVVDNALKEGYYALSIEVLPEFAGDYMIISKNPDTDNSYQESETYKNIPAVKNNRVFEANAKEFYFNDPISLEYQLEFFKQHFLGS